MINSHDVPKPLVTTGGDDIDQMKAWVTPHDTPELAERRRLTQENLDRKRRADRLAHHVIVDMPPSIEQAIMVNDPDFVAARRAALQREWGPRE